MKYLIFFLSLGLLVLSCNHYVNRDLPYNIDLENSLTNVKSVPLSTLGNKLEYIPLETDTSCLLQEISNVYLTDSLIFVSDYNRLLKFDINGKFIKQIGKKGRGPGEYPTMGNFVADDSNKEIFVLSSRILLVYDYEGNFKRDFKIDFPSRQFLLNQKNELILHPFNMPFSAADPVYSWYIMDRTGTIHHKIENTLKRTNKGVVVPVSPLYMFESTPHFMEFGVDTLYNYVDDELKPYVIFQFGKVKFPPDPTMAEVPEINGKVWINEIRETEKLIFVNLWRDLSDSISNCIFDKKTATFSILKNGGFTNDIDGGLAFWPKKLINDKLMIDYADAFDFITLAKKGGSNRAGQFNNLVNQLSETSNPVIIILKNK